ncbi:MAG TPA: preprotein translocase subunit YajC [Ruminococcus sp.]|nr:preprotein translocase subunit YajC [Ruminococcus sp.]
MMLTLMTTSSANTQADPGAIIGSLLPMVIILLFFYFIFMRPQKKKEKETEKMRNNLEIGDEIVTIGGIVGIVVRKTNEDTVVIETGGDRNKIRVKLWAVQENIIAKEKASAVSEDKPEKKKKKDKENEKEE